MQERTAAAGKVVVIASPAQRDEAISYFAVDMGLQNLSGPKPCLPTGREESWSLLRRSAPRKDRNGCCHCESRPAGRSNLIFRTKMGSG